MPVRSCPWRSRLADMCIRALREWHFDGTLEQANAKSSDAERLAIAGQDGRNITAHPVVTVLATAGACAMPA